jgi:G3E family GTPase
VLTANHGKRVAVIQNEFGEDLGLGSTVAAEGLGGEVFEECYEMNNGCICCSVRDELVNTLERIMTKRHKFDYVLVETTGMANPGPIASIFWLDDELGSDLFLDAIITLVDAKHVLQHLDDASASSGSFEVAQQIAFADRILLNKIDLVDEQHLAVVEQRIRFPIPRSLAPLPTHALFASARARMQERRVYVRARVCAYKRCSSLLALSCVQANQRYGPHCAHVQVRRGFAGYPRCACL